MFACTQCIERYTVEDVKEGRFFPSTSTCLSCYQKMAKSKVRCFGKEKMFDLKQLACQECPDSRICRTFLRHKEQF
jgi:hypothetical protein